MFETLPHNTPEIPFAMTNATPQAALFSTSASGLTSGLASTSAPRSAPPQNLVAAPLVLTVSERAIALLVAEGARNHDIARQLGVSHRTVESHLSNIFAKLGIASRVQLALWIAGSAKADS
jgi:DNA-binding NarL/FixJ family response regulator